MTEIAEHDSEPVPGLPEELPDSERMLWQGKPSWTAFAVTGLHARKIVIYFAVVLGLQLSLLLSQGATLAASLAETAGYAVLAAVAVGVVSLYAWLTGRATMYTITDRRVVIRCGVALPLSVNLPFRKIDAVELRRHANGSGDIVLRPAADCRASYVLLWPHVKPWRLTHVSPMLRAVPDADGVAGRLTEALGSAAAGPRPAPVGELPEREPHADEAERGFRPYPTIPLAAAVSLVVVSVLSVAFVRVTGGDAAAPAPAAVVAAIDLRFQDRQDGAVVVIDAATDAEIDVLEPGTHGFTRSTLRGLARARKARGAGMEVPFSLTQTEAGRLLLSDPVTGREVDLWAFGATNALAFARYLGPADQDQRILQTRVAEEDGRL